MRLMLPPLHKTAPVCRARPKMSSQQVRLYSEKAAANARLPNQTTVSQAMKAGSGLWVFPRVSNITMRTAAVSDRAMTAAA